MPKKAFLEITNACNLSCSFCHKTKRPLKYITLDEFKVACKEASAFADFLYFHLMGEPLLHPKLGEFFNVAEGEGLRVIITTNGTLLKKREKELLSASNLYKISISLHSFEANEMGMEMEKYLFDCFDFCRKASEKGKICVLRLWNSGGAEERNGEILSFMHSFFEGEWKETRSGYKLKDKVFLEWGEKFDWPDIDGEYLGSDHTCWGLRDQIGILSDGTVVPCCLDADGAVALGNIFEEKLSDILSSERAVKLKESLQRRNVCEELCQKCGYARLKKY